VACKSKLARRVSCVCICIYEIGIREERFNEESPVKEEIEIKNPPKMQQIAQIRHTAQYKWKRVGEIERKEKEREEN
jgi:hypothetical protein